MPESDGISELDPASALTGTEPIPTVQGGITVKTTPDAIKDLIAASPVMQFKGQADASAVDEDAATGTSTFQTGDVYRINVAASAPHAFSDISEDLNIGDWVVFNGTIFEKQDGTDPTAVETKTAYESNADTNAFDDAAVSKLGGIELLADVTDTANVTAAGALMDSEVDADLKTFSLPASTTISVFGASLVDDATAVAARTTLGLVIGTDVQAWSAVLDGTTASFTTAEETKLGGIEALADVTDTANVTAAGALMDSEVDADLKTLSLPASTTISVFGASLIDDATAAAARTTLDVDQAGTDNSTDVTLAGTPDYITISGQIITRNAVNLTTDITGILPSTGGGTGNGFTKITGPTTAEKTFTLPDASATILTDNTDVTIAQGGTGSGTAAGARTNLGLVIGTDVQAWSAVLDGTTASFTTADETKLDGIEALADVTDTANVDAAGAVMETDYNAQTILVAVADDTPAAVTIPASNFVGRKATGDAGVMTVAESNIVLGTDTLLAAEEILLNDQSSGIIDGGIISINGGDNTKFDFTALTLHIVDSFTDPLNPTITIVEITAQAAIAATEVVTDNETFVGIRLDNVAPAGGTATAVSATVDGSAGTVYITQKPSEEYTREETRDIVQIGAILHSGVVITQVFNLQQIVNNTALQLYDFAFAVGIINISGNEFSANGVNLNIDKTVGDIFRQGSNNDGTAAGLKNPNISTVAAASPVTFKYRFQDGGGGFTVGSDTTTIDPDQYDDGDGVLGTVGNNKWTIQKLYVGPNGDIRVEYGQVIYNSESEAEAAIATATVTDPVLTAETAFRGWLIVKKGATDLSDTADAKFIAAGKFNISTAGSMSGEINTASNVGTGGIGVFKQKTGVNLEFNNINAQSDKVAVTLNAGLNEVRIDVVEANIDTSALNNDAGFLATVDLTADVTGILPSLNGGTANGFTAFTGPTTAEKTFTLPDASAVVLTDNTNVTVAQGGTDAGTAAGARTNLGLVIGTDVQAWSAVLDATTASFTTADETKLDAIEALADVTDTTNVTAAGALMDSEVDADIKTLSLPASTTISTFGASLVDDADAGTARATLGAKAIGKETIWIPATGMTPATTSGAAVGQHESTTNKVNIEVLDFDSVADEFAHFNIAFPKAWNLGTVTFQVFWTAAAGGTTGVAWALQGVAIGDNVAIDTAYGTAIVVTDDAQTGAHETYVTAESAAVTIAGTPADDEISYFRLLRDVSDANDDLAEDARLLGIKLFFTLDAEDDT